LTGGSYSPETNDNPVNSSNQSIIYLYAINLSISIHPPIVCLLQFLSSVCVGLGGSGRELRTSGL